MSISDWFSYLFGFWGWPTTAYIVAQVVVPIVLPSPWRFVALLPLPFMLLLLYATDRGFAAQSPQAPILLIFASPVAFIALCLLFVASRAMTRKT
jgi:hypothetical protein